MFNKSKLVGNFYIFIIKLTLNSIIWIGLYSLHKLSKSVLLAIDNTGTFNSIFFLKISANNIFKTETKGREPRKISLLTLWILELLSDTRITFSSNFIFEKVILWFYHLQWLLYFLNSYLISSKNLIFKGIHL